VKLCSGDEHNQEHIGSSTWFNLASIFVTTGQHTASHEVSQMPSEQAMQSN